MPYIPKRLPKAKGKRLFHFSEAIDAWLETASKAARQSRVEFVEDILERIMLSRAKKR